MTTLPDVSMNIQSNGLGLTPSNAVDVCAKLGISAGGVPNTIYSFGDENTALSTLVAGPGLEDVLDTLNTPGAGGPVIYVPLNPSVAGSIGSTVQVGTGAGTVTGSAAPAQTIKVKIMTGGVLGTMTASFSVNNGPYSAPVLSVVTSWAYLVPGTLTVLTFSAQTYTTAAVWTFNTDGTSSLSGTGTPGWITQASSSMDNYDVLVSIPLGGALGAAQFIYSVDGGKNPSAPLLVPSGGVFVIPGAGVVLTFASTFVLNDTYEFKTSTAGYTNTDVNNALTALFASNTTQFGFIHVIGMGANAAAAASQAAAIDVKLETAEAAFRYVRGVMECPMGESDNTIAAAFLNFNSWNGRLAVCVGDVLHVSQISGFQIRRNMAVVVTTRMSSIAPSISPSNNSNDEFTSLPNITKIFRDEFATPGLDAQRFMTTRTEPGVSGFFLTSPVTMAQYGSDFSIMQNGRVMDVACRSTRLVMLPFLQSRIQVDAQTGFITKVWASRVEKRATAVDKAALNIPGDNADASAVSVSVARNVNILSTKIVPVTVGIIPFGYADFINVTISFVNPALS